MDAPDAQVTASRPGPTVRGRPVADLSALVGGILWVGAVGATLTGRLPLGEVDLFVALAVLLVVPLGLGQVPSPDSPRVLGVLYSAATLALIPAAVGVVAALALPVGSVASIVLALPWMGVTGLLALGGLARLLDRGLRPLPALAVDAALLYLPVGAVALVLHRAGITFHFRPIIILLTVVHYHYAGFALPLVTGFAGERLTGGEAFGGDAIGRLGAVATIVIIVNLALIAVGITFSPLVEVAAVSLFTVAVAVFAAIVLYRVVPSLPHVAGGLLAVASLTLFATMALAMAYGYSAFPATARLLDIGAMIRWHGTLNALGFALPGLLAIRWLSPPG